ncbi:MAG TPA: DNA-binding response regulator [Gemmatimonas aurantiaca]|uniref:Two-component response regulator n=2 Tax=Gemmatimonas aurantiaca TaxID=173480 RepID=C1ABW9_GEMAT|nr:LytTR family DNA-binding domain-containing protein [Gemmatimonas aurantiaca]BAH39996.1 two-component response regulator [Gemmatimonas aurantiaca T-27]HCT57996.1 DNA-binding response regulator [Gemmatimonas aurantiaca]
MSATPLRVVIAEDEPLPRASLRRLLAARADVDVVGEAEQGVEAQALIESCKPDVVILDIRMPERDGIEVAASVLANLDEPPAIVFVTAFDEYAVRAFDLHAVDYLLKPIDAEHLDRALARVFARIVAQRSTGTSDGTSDGTSASTSTAARLDPALLTVLEELRIERALPQRFAVRDAKGGTYWVKSADIDWVDAQSNYVRLHAKGQQHLVRDTMKAFQQKLSATRFVRIHRSVIVNIDFIQRVEPHLHGEQIVTLRDGTRLRTSKSHGAGLDRLMR